MGCGVGGAAGLVIFVFAFLNFDSFRVGREAGSAQLSITETVKLAELPCRVLHMSFSVIGRECGSFR
jgi:hypothetical protein